MADAVEKICGGAGAFCWVLFLAVALFFNDPLTDWIDARIERYRAETEAIRHKAKEAQA